MLQLVVFDELCFSETLYSKKYIMLSVSFCKSYIKMSVLEFSVFIFSKNCNEVCCGKKFQFKLRKN